VEEEQSQSFDNGPKEDGVTKAINSSLA